MVTFLGATLVRPGLIESPYTTVDTSHDKLKFALQVELKAKIIPASRKFTDHYFTRKATFRPPNPYFVTVNLVDRSVLNFFGLVTFFSLWNHLPKIF